MKTIIAGSRTINDYELLKKVIQSCPFNITSVVSGGAIGVDYLGEQYAFEYKLPIEVFQANWKTYGKSAGILRNKTMAENAEALLVLWDGVSSGTKNMIEEATKLNLLTHIYILK